MKHTKKLLALLMALLTAFSMAACGSSSDDDHTADSHTSSNTEVNDPNSSESSSTDINDPNNSARSVIEAFAQAYETGKMTEIEPLIHKDVVAKIELTSESLLEAEEQLIADRSANPVSIQVMDAIPHEDDVPGDLVEEYQELYGLEVEDMQEFPLQITVEENGETQVFTQYYFVLKIDGKWYLNAGGGATASS